MCPLPAPFSTCPSEWIRAAPHPLSCPLPTLALKAQALGLDVLTEEEMEAVFNAIDKNGNGVLTIGVAPLPPSSLSSSRPTHSPGLRPLVSPDEVEGVMRQTICEECMSSEGQDSRVTSFMCHFDTNGDGEVRPSASPLPLPPFPSP